MNEKQFATYVEQVFRHHNRVLNELITAQDTLSESTRADEDEVEEAESEMIQTCDPLNEVVSAEAEQRHASFSALLKLADVVPECESMTRELEILLHPPAVLDDDAKAAPDMGATKTPPTTRTAP